MQEIQRSTVSVIIPVYNVEQYLEECLDSAVNQTLHDIEIICINDGSTDLSPEILEKYRVTDSRITVLDQENRGISAARNRGLQIARGEYIAFLDSDDRLEPEALELLVDTARKNDAEIVVFQRDIFYETEELAEKHFSTLNTVDRVSDVCTGVTFIRQSKDANTYNVAVWHALWRRDLLEKNGISFMEGIIHEDYLFSFQTYMAAARVIQIPDILYHSRVRDNSIITVPVSARNVHGLFYSAKAILEYGLSGPHEAEKEREICREYIRLGNKTEKAFRDLPADGQADMKFPEELDSILFRQMVRSAQTDRLIKENSRLVKSARETSKETEKLSLQLEELTERNKDLALQAEELAERNKKLVLQIDEFERKSSRVRSARNAIGIYLGRAKKKISHKLGIGKARNDKEGSDDLNTDDEI